MASPMVLTATLSTFSNAPPTPASAIKRTLPTALKALNSIISIAGTQIERYTIWLAITPAQGVRVDTISRVCLTVDEIVEVSSDKEYCNWIV